MIFASETQDFDLPICEVMNACCFKLLRFVVIHFSNSKTLT